MKKSLLSVLFIAALAVACGSEGGANSDPTTDSDAGSPTTGGNGGNGNGKGNGKADSGLHDVTPLPDAGAPIDQDGGVVDTSDSGTGDTTDSGTGTGDQDSGTGTGDQDSGTGGGDQDGGVVDTGDSGSGGGGGDVDSGTGGGGGDQDSGTGGGTVDSGTGGGGGDQDGGSGGGTTDSGTGGGGGDQDSGHGGDCTPHSCVLSQGYYKVHTVNWTGPALVLGGVSYTQQEWVALLGLMPQGDDSVILAKQLIAALLNGGACDANASATVQAAQDWMAANKDADGRLPYGTACVNSSDPGCTAWSLGQTLDAYNNGLSGTPHCQ